jgi:hypothetical protein
VLRQIDDPGAHGSWLLIRDPAHRAGPGRFIWVPRTQTNHAQGDTRGSFTPMAYKPVILAGDRLVIEEETPIVEARLAATALEPAPVGSAFNARLEIAGKVVRAIALGPGRAQFASETQSAPETRFASEFGAQP